MNCKAGERIQILLLIIIMEYPLPDIVLGCRLERDALVGNAKPEEYKEHQGTVVRRPQ